MIIDDVHEVAFVHIPKCGGTSVRNQLAPIDSCNGAFYGRKPHDRLGLLDYCHIPLPVLATAFPAAFEKVTTYRSFALVRDPHDRFASATFERLALFSGVPRSQTTGAMAIKEAEAVIAWLEARTNFCEASYIHFARQIDYVALEGRPIVRNIFALEDMAGFGREIGRLTGLSFDPAVHDNPNMASPNRLLGALRGVKPLYSRISTSRQRTAVVKLLRRLRVQAPDAFYAEFRGNAAIAAFVESYYADDFRLYADAKARVTPRWAETQGSPPVGAERV